MLILDTTSSLIQIITSAAQALDVHTSYADNASGTITPSHANTIIATATTTTVVGSPGSSTQRNVKLLSAFNNGSAANTVTVQHYDGTTTILLCKMTLAVGEALHYSESSGFYRLNASGMVLTAAANGAVNQVASTTGITATSTSAFVMAGAGGLITPQRSGNIAVDFCGWVSASSTTINEGIIAQIAYGTGTSVPTVHAAATGTLVGEPMEYSNAAVLTTAADLKLPFSLQSLILGLQVGTEYWVDLQVEAITGTSVVTINDPVLTLCEI